MKGLFILHPHSYEAIYGPDAVAEIGSMIEMCAPLQTPESVRENPEVLREAEAVMTGWGGPKIDSEFLRHAPELKVVFYGAGSIKGIVTDAFWDRGVAITSAYSANAVPVAEYSLSQILFCLKHGWQFALQVKRDGAYPKQRTSFPGAYGSTVGIVSLGMIGRIVCDLLRRFDVKVVAYDPFAAPDDAAELGVELCSLQELFKRSHVVSIHTPWLKETEGLITGELIASMRDGACLINTSRGAVIDEPAMIRVLQERADLFAVLDVTHPEPPEPGSPLFTLPNVIVTPHIAGSMEGECRRMGRYMIDELRRYLAGEPMKWQITRERAAVMA